MKLFGFAHTLNARSCSGRLKLLPGKAWLEWSLIKSKHL